MSGARSVHLDHSGSGVASYTGAAPGSYPGNTGFEALAAHSGGSEGNWQTSRAQNSRLARSNRAFRTDAVNTDAVNTDAVNTDAVNTDAVNTDAGSSNGRTTGPEPVNRGSSPCPAAPPLHLRALVAQQVERVSRNDEVARSIRARGSPRAIGSRSNRDVSGTNMHKSARTPTGRETGPRCRTVRVRIPPSAPGHATVRQLDRPRQDPRRVACPHCLLGATG